VLVGAVPTVAAVTVVLGDDAVLGGVVGGCAIGFDVGGLLVCVLGLVATVVVVVDEVVVVKLGSGVLNGGGCFPYASGSFTPSNTKIWSPYFTRDGK
jgi:hypothetical protein